MLIVSGGADYRSIVGRHSCGCFIQESPNQRHTDHVTLWWEPCELHETDAMTLFGRYNVNIPDSEVHKLLNP